jgi:hypothetical protein
VLRITATALYLSLAARGRRLAATDIDRFHEQHCPSWLKGITCTAAVGFDLLAEAALSHHFAGHHLGGHQGTLTQLFTGA